MKLKLLSGIAVSLLLFCWINACQNKRQPTAAMGESAVKEYYARQTDSLLLLLDGLLQHAESGAEIAQLQADFASCRFRYKKIESIAEYYFQGLVQRINGPALPDVNLQDGQVWPPHGFQVLEQILFENYQDISKTRLSEEIRLLQTDLRFMNSNLKEQSILPRHLQELLRHEFIRIATMGITGADAPLSKLSIQEAVFSLNAIRDLAKAFGIVYKNDVLELFGRSILFLDQHPRFDSFNRLEFLTSYLMPLSEKCDWQHQQAQDSLLMRPFRGTLMHLMRGEGFDPDYYSGYSSAKSSPVKVLLGRKLFADKRLSGSGKISCASCHKPELAFTDGLAKAGDFVHGGSLPRNTPTLYYSGLQSSQFYDLRAASLEDQADFVMSNHSEFNSSSKKIARLLWNDSNYQELFRRAFPSKKDSIGGYEVRNALAAFVRSLNPFSSAFDDFMRGNKTAMNADQKRGFNLFTGKAKCATCHFIPLFNGSVPPWFTNTESEIIGVPARAVFQNAVMDRDSGRYQIHRFQEYLFAFKTAGLRNVEKTAPYMHNGVFRTLDEVVEFYHKGGGAGIGMDLPAQTLPFDSLMLNESEKKAVVAFLESLTDKQRGH